MKIYLGTDHAGFEYKEKVKEHLLASGHEVEDLGAHTLDLADDYPDYITPVAKKVAEDSDAFGIIFGGSGQGEAMCANRIPGVRAALYYGGTKDFVALVREHNNANVLSVGARFLDLTDVLEAVDIFLQTPFSNEPRHVRRLSKF